ncbi:hypothetical protein, partial [Burkholderia multivorans]|uniref:hypothetical protein n=1 Tax=Burkholderia multivorans TaxID=87883 RepID=UPI0028704372
TRFYDLHREINPCLGSSYLHGFTNTLIRHIENRDTRLMVERRLVKKTDTVADKTLMRRTFRSLNQQVPDYESQSEVSNHSCNCVCRSWRRMVVSAFAC